MSDEHTQHDGTSDLQSAIELLFGSFRKEPFAPKVVYHRPTDTLLLLTENTRWTTSFQNPYLDLLYSCGNESSRRLVGVQLRSFLATIQSGSDFVGEVCGVRAPWRVAYDAEIARLTAGLSIEQAIARLVEHRKGDAPPVYPIADYNFAGQQLEVVYSAGEYYGKFVNHWLTLYLARENEGVIGVVITGFPALCGSDDSERRQRLSGLVSS